jgi:cystathionine beta-lyase
LSSLLKGRALAYGSGLAALNGALVLLNPKKIAVGDNYHGCHGVIDIFNRLTGLKKLELDCPDEELQAGDVILLETPLNPDGTAFNIEHYAQKAHSRGAFLIVDSTFGPPGLQDPFEFGADIVMHSGSKYFGGHSDMLCGVLATKRSDWFNELFSQRIYLGNNMGNLESWLGVRSLRTLELRVQRASENATRLVAMLDSAMKQSADNTAAAAGTDAEAIIVRVLAEVRHASLQPEPWVKKQMPNGYGPVFSIIMKDEDLARKLPSKLKYFHHATSLGGVESLIEWRAMSDTRVDRRLLRVSVGIENWEDLRDDLVLAFKALIA